MVDAGTIAGLIPVGVLPLSLAGIIGLLITTFIIFIALVIADKVIAHEMNIKHVLIMAFLCAFIVPIITTIALQFLSIPVGFSQIFYYGLPLLSWVVLGEVLLGGEFKEKLAVAFIAFAVFTALQMFGISAMLMGFLPI
ncbi:MAG: hypothetical protein HZB65_00370 [Candidatus Aenigmarchaeota archaeon]|nr:hypothetical protein [Candidatus Aenigmarchaeota archaeon]